MGEQRKIKRRYKTLAQKKRVKETFEETYLDNLGNEYNYKWVARLSSFVNIINGCFRNGFPMVLPKWFWYPAWAFYPFMFLRKDLGLDGLEAIIVHERIHIRQQRDIHIFFSLPIFLGLLIMEVTKGIPLFALIGALIVIISLPTVFYAIDMFRSLLWCLKTLPIDEVTFSRVREETCFERECNAHSLNTDYLRERKMWAVLKYI